jgi:hypothetical protein
MKKLRLLLLLPILGLASCGGKADTAEKVEVKDATFAEATRLNITRDDLIGVSIEEGELHASVGSFVYKYHSSSAEDLDKVAKFFDMTFKVDTDKSVASNSNKYYKYTFITDAGSYDIKFEKGIYHSINNNYRPDNYFDFDLDKSKCNLSIDLADKIYKLEDRNNQLIKAYDNLMIEKFELEKSDKTVEKDSYISSISINDELAIYVYDATTIMYKDVLYNIVNDEIEVK